jgi:nicotinate phosphoribosyltransferase
MLTDTFTAQAFFADYRSDPTRALRWTTLRQDSGDPMTFARQAKEAVEDVYVAAGKRKEEAQARFIFSDGLHLDNAVELQKGCDELGVAGECSLSYAILTDRSWDTKARHHGARYS